jgi:hypothetical protein
MTEAYAYLVLLLLMRVLGLQALILALDLLHSLNLLLQLSFKLGFCCHMRPAKCWMLVTVTNGHGYIYLLVLLLELKLMVSALLVRRIDFSLLLDKGLGQLCHRKPSNRYAYWYTGEGSCTSSLLCCKRRNALWIC